MHVASLLKIILPGIIAQAAHAQSQTPAQFCASHSPNSYAVYEADGTFNGRCEKNPGQLCLGTEYQTPKQGTICCTSGLVMAVDSANQNAACCASGKVYSNGACADPSPAIQCPGSNGQMVRHSNGVQFQVWCGRNIIEYTDPFDWTGKINAILNMNKRGTATLQNCWDICAADPKCQGTNWWWGKGGCGINNYPEQSASIFRRGGKYQNPPDVAWFDPRVIALVAVPKR
ncbi:hypothetical protein F4778DRAFT_763886 [Xylariomycetidae sp. FL2044]|nr:hypothetical protein F4778DRAFT_763886 [Xylariomycetidae sp. FL2044]